VSDNIYRTALEAERKMHEDCNADLNRALDTIADLQDNLQIAQGALGESWRQLAERYAEIADLRARLNESQRRIGERYAEIARLLTQIAELQAWKDAVPVKELNRMMTVAPFDSVEADIVWRWLKFSR